MMALVHSKVYENHKTGVHPENNERIQVIMDTLEKQGILNHVTNNSIPRSKNKIDVFTPETASRKDILRVHSESYVKYLKSFCDSGGGYLDNDTVASRDSYKIAKLAAGGAITASKLVLNGYNSSYSVARPPGHHATREKAMGFCLFNNIAIAIEYLKKYNKIKKFIIFDFDVHYGNGTAEMYLNDPNVMYISIHQDPNTLFPGSGFIEEIGVDEGEGYNMNIPMPPGSSNQDYMYVLERILKPVFNDFDAEFQFLEVGFDSHRDDPLSRINLDDDFYPWITSKIMQITNQLVLILEGGYNLSVLSRCNMKMINVLRNELTYEEEINKIENKQEVSNETKQIFHKIQNIFSSFYDF